MLIEQTGQGKVRLYDVKTGEPIERWPVDARGMVDAGTHTYQMPTRGKKGEAAQGPADGELLPGDAIPQFDPVKTPSMDPVLGAPSGEVEMQLGASTEVSVGVEPEGVAETAEAMAKGDPGASKVWPTEETLPKTTPLGQPATYSRAKDAGPAKVDQAPVRTRGPGKGNR